MHLTWGTSLNEVSSQSHSTLSPSGREAIQILDDLYNVLDNDEEGGGTTISTSTTENLPEQQAKFGPAHRQQSDRAAKITIQQEQSVTIHQIQIDSVKCENSPQPLEKRSLTHEVKVYFMTYNNEFKDNDLPPPEPPVDYEDIPRQKYYQEAKESIKGCLIARL